MNLFTDIRELVLASIHAMQADGALPGELNLVPVTVEPPRDPAHGDMATNAAMVLAKPAKQKPRDIAEALAARLATDPRVASADVAGPGFLNLRLDPSVWQGLPEAILSAGKDYGRSTFGAQQKVNVEFVSANPTGPMHVGHTRGAVVGDALAALLDFAGYDVTREYYINDGGAQVDVLARSVYLRYLEAHGESVEFPEGTYPGDYLVPVGQKLKELKGDAFVGKGEEVWLAEIREFATEEMMELIREDLRVLGVVMDNYYSEKSLYGTGRIEAAIADLEGKGLIYDGVLEPPKGKKPEDWEPREQTLFKSTEHGDDVDRPIKKSDGSWTYFAPDIAYHYDKVTRGYDQLIDIFGADHGGYVKRMKAAVSALSGGKTPLDIKLIQLVKLFKNGEPFKMSKRAGTFVTLRDVVDQVGADVTRFIMLTRKNDAALDFDFDKALEQSKENPVYYVNYAYSRVGSMVAKASNAGFDVSDEALLDADYSLLTLKEEVALLRKLSEWPRLVEIAAKTHEPHRISYYAYELASDFNSLYSMTKHVAGNEYDMVHNDNEALTKAKISLARSVAVVISAGLGILGVTPAEKM